MLEKRSNNNRKGTSAKGLKKPCDLEGQQHIFNLRSR